MPAFLIALSIIVLLSTLTCCSQETHFNNEEAMKSVDNYASNLPTDRRLNHNEAMGLAGDDFNYVYDINLEDIEYLKQRAQDPNEINAQYALATYETWHHNEPIIETKGYQTIFELAKLGQPHACADVYNWSKGNSDEFFKNILKIKKQEINKIRDTCLDKALKYNANMIKLDYIEYFFTDYVKEKNYSQLSPKRMKNADKVRIQRTKEFLLMYLFSRKNYFMNDVPNNNLANVDMISQYLQILAFDPYQFDSLEACSWLRYYDKDVLPYLTVHELPQSTRIPEELEFALSVLRQKLQNSQVDIKHCQTRYIEIRDTKRELDLFEKEFY